RPEHKKECKKRTAALFDEALFKQPPPKEDCPICFLQLPSGADTVYQPCCGKDQCRGCMYKMDKGSSICPFCRMPAVKSNEEMVKRFKKRMEASDAGAFFQLGTTYLFGDWGLPQDTKKALELLLRAVELGSNEAQYTIAVIYDNEKFMEKDHKKSLYHFQRAAMGGCEKSRYDLGCRELDGGNVDRAMKHWMIAAATGSKDSVKIIKK
ncbi:hypothetical protein ACHAXR_003377, partial [Thalassiosira sp. AJA248-18]